MPVNEILAPFYAKVFYRVGTLPTHSIRLYFDAIPSYSAGGAVFDTYTDADHLTGWTLHDIIKEIDTRLALATTQYPSIEVIRVERWEGVTGANAFRGYDPADYSDVDDGVASSIAAAMFSWVIQTDERDNYRFSIIDSGDSKPQRFEIPQPPVLDNDGISWFFLRSAVQFTNQDGVRLTRMVSNNTGVSDYHAKRYGKTVIP